MQHCFLKFTLAITSSLALLAVDAAYRGRVLDSSGRPVAGASVTLEHTVTVDKFTARTGADGTFQFDTLVTGAWRLTIERPGFQKIESKVQITTGVFKLATFKLVAVVAKTAPVAHSFPASRFGSGSGSGGGMGGGVYRIQGSVAALTGAAPKREEYGAIAEQDFAETASRPVSTFSADVDTAAYSNVRRILKSGRMPPPDAVRVEEMLNYFHYDYPNPPPDQPFSVTTAMTECPWNSGNVMLHVGLKTASIETAKLPPNNLVFLIDVSGSMDEPAKLPLIKRSLSMLVEQLRPQDEVAIVVYAGAAGLVLPPTPGSNRERIWQALEDMSAGGSTAGAAGIRLAYQTAVQNFMRNGNNRVILATDGDFNVGASGDEELIKLIEEHRDQGVFLTVLGYGYGNLKDSKLEKLADHGNGNYAYIDSQLEARRVLVQELGATLVTVAKDVKLQVEFDPTDVKAWRLIGYENRRLKTEDFANDKKDAGDLGAGHTVTALYELTPAGLVQVAKPVRLRLRYKDPMESASREIVSPIEFKVVPIASASPDTRLAAGIAQFGMVLRASRHRGAGTYDGAIQLMESGLPGEKQGQRAELLELIKTAKNLDAKQARN